jgi:hypothetical protein
MIALAAGCATLPSPVGLQPQPARESARYVQSVDTQTISLATDTFDVTASGSVLEDVMTVYVEFKNKTAKQVSFGPENVALLSNGETLARIDGADVAQSYRESASQYAQAAAAYNSGYDADNEQLDAVRAQGGPLNPGERPRAAMRYSDTLGTLSNNANYDGSMATNNQKRAEFYQNLSFSTEVEALESCVPSMCIVNPGDTNQGSVYFLAPKQWPVTARMSVNGSAVSAEFNLPKSDR